MKSFLVSNIDGSNGRIIEADSFTIDENSAGVLFHDEDSNLIARLLNVLVEPAPVNRFSSKEMVALAQKVMKDKDASEDAKSLAGSVLSQANPKD